MKELGYIGDGVYLSHDGYQFWLAANNHENKVIALEPNVVMHLFRQIVRHDHALIEGMQNILNYEQEINDDNADR